MFLKEKQIWAKTEYGFLYLNITEHDLKSDHFASTLVMTNVTETVPSGEDVVVLCFLTVTDREDAMIGLSREC